MQARAIQSDIRMQVARIVKEVLSADRGSEEKEINREQLTESDPSHQLCPERKALLGLERSHARPRYKHGKTDQPDLHAQDRPRQAVSFRRAQSLLTRRSLHQQTFLKREIQYAENQDEQSTKETGHKISMCWRSQKSKTTHIRFGSSTLMAGSKVKMLIAAQPKAHVPQRIQFFRTKSDP